MCSGLQRCVLSSIGSGQRRGTHWHFRFFQKTILKSRHHRADLPHSRHGHHRAFARGLGPPDPQSGGDVEDSGAGLAALLGAWTAGVMTVSARRGALPSRFSFPDLELLGSGHPVCEKTCRMIIELFLSPDVVGFLSAAPPQLCIVFHNLRAR